MSGKANPKWDFDLARGLEGEGIVQGLLQGGSKVEVKRDYIASTSGNIAIEYDYRGRPSGIAVTEADWWAIVVHRKGFDDTVILIETKRLKELCRRHYGNRIKGGDDHASKMVLVPVCEILS